jgi:hypothetical protein
MVYHDQNYWVILVHYHGHQSPLLVPSLSHTLSPHLRRNLFTISYYLYLGFLSGLFLSRIPTKITYSLSGARVCACVCPIYAFCLFSILYSIILNKPYKCRF